MPSPPTEHTPFALHDALPIFKGAVLESLPPPGSNAAGRIERGRQDRTRPAGSSAAGEEQAPWGARAEAVGQPAREAPQPPPARLDRKSTRLNSSHLGISYAVSAHRAHAVCPPRRSSDLQGRGIGIATAARIKRGRQDRTRPAGSNAARRLKRGRRGAGALGRPRRGRRAARPRSAAAASGPSRSEEHTSELQSLRHLVCRLRPPSTRRLPSTTLFRSSRARYWNRYRRQDQTRPAGSNAAGRIERGPPAQARPERSRRPGAPAPRP